MSERTDDNGNPMVEIDYSRKCTCDKRTPTLVNYSMMWHDGDIVCANCTGFIRWYDAG